MKFIHISDLHLGKRINEYSMIEDQKFILEQILDIAEREQPQMVLIAGDVYDRSIPSTEALEIFEGFLCRLSDAGHQVYIISGNHDSAERLSFGSRLMEQSGIHMAQALGKQTFEGKAVYELEDEHGKIDLYLLPFLKPATLRHALLAAGKITEEEAAGIDTYTKAMAAAIAALDVDPDRRNILVSHQFVTGAKRSESEEVMVGGLDNIDGDVFDGFDYVALGHLHGPQTLGERAQIRYCGSPLKYSFSEVNQKKSVTVVEIGEDRTATIREVPLKPLHEWIDICGTFEQVTGDDFLTQTDREAYTRITLLDEDDVPDAVGRLKLCYPNMMSMRYDNKRTRQEQDLSHGAELEQRSEMDLFRELFEMQNNMSMNEKQTDLVKKLIEEIKEEMI